MSDELKWSGDSIRQALDACFAAGLGVAEAAELAKHHARFWTPLAMRNAASHLKGVPPAEMGNAIDALAATNPEFGQTLKKEPGSAAGKSSPALDPLGKPILPPPADVTMTSIPARAAAFNEAMQQARANHGFDSTAALRGKRK